MNTFASRLSLTSFLSILRAKLPSHFTFRLSFYLIFRLMARAALFLAGTAILCQVTQAESETQSPNSNVPPAPTHKLKKPPPTSSGFEQYAGQGADSRLVAAAAGGRGRPPRNAESDFLYAQGLNATRAGHYQKAVEAFKDAINLEPDNALAYYQLGLAAGRLGRHSEALQAFNKVVRLIPDSAAACYNSGVAHGELGQYGEAIAAFERAIALKPAWETAHYNLGVASSRLEMHEEAVEAFKQSIIRKPNYIEAHFKLGFEYVALGNRKAALAQVQALKKLRQIGLANALNRVILTATSRGI